MKMKVRPQLFIDIKPLEDKELALKIFEETDKYSVTPTTFKARILNKDNVWYKDEYSHFESKVTRYGINSNAVKADLEKNTILGEPVDLFDTTKKVEKSVKSSQYKLEDAQKISHHGLEKYILQQAINQLLESKGKTVLVDIFARENGAIKVLKDSIPETHTIVLYKNPPSIDKKHEILVIDPSNFLFSSHLSNLNGTTKHELLNKITTIHKTLQIYKPISDYTGPNPDQYRDCIDIAVKIAFGLDREKDQAISLDNMKDSQTVKIISNNQTINKSMPDDMHTKQFVKAPLRIQQKSNINIGESFFKFSKIIKENLTNLLKKEYFEDVYIKELLDSDKKVSTETLSILHSIGKDTFDQIHKELEALEIQILGKEFDPNLYNSEDFI